MQIFDKKLHDALDAFIAEFPNWNAPQKSFFSNRTSWLRGEYAEFYVRLGSTRALGLWDKNKAVPERKMKYFTLDVSNIAVYPHMQGKKIFTRLIEFIEAKNLPIFVENVHDERFQRFFQKRGYKTYEPDVDGVVKSFYRLPLDKISLFSQDWTRRLIEIGAACEKADSFAVCTSNTPLRSVFQVYNELFEAELRKTIEEISQENTKSKTSYVEWVRPDIVTRQPLKRLIPVDEKNNVQVSIPLSAYQRLVGWASVGRTISGVIRENNGVTENNGEHFEDLAELQPALNDIHQACRNHWSDLPKEDTDNEK